LVKYFENLFMNLLGKKFPILILNKSFFQVMKFTISVSLLPILTSCAFIDQEVFLEYGQAHYAGTKIDKKLYINRFNDCRNDKVRIGIVKNGYGFETANVVTKQDVCLWIGNCLTMELEKAGYNVIKTDISIRDIPFDKNIFLDGHVLKVFSEPVIGLWGIDFVSNISVKIDIYYSGKKYSKIYNTNSTEFTMICIRAADWFKMTLESAVRKMALQITNDIVELSKRF